MMVLYIDADACPVKDEALHVAERHGMDVFIVSNSWLRLSVGPKVQKIVVSDGADAADDWIVERVGEGDLVVTNDIPLADRTLKKGGFAIGATGKPFTTANIGTAMAQRALNQHLRESNVLGAGFNPSFTKQDKSAFLRGMEELIQKIKRGKPA